VADLDQLERQVFYLTEALKRLREGRFEGAGGLDAMIVALQGGQPLNFTPSWPPASLAGADSPEPAAGMDETGRLLRNGPYWSDPDFEADLNRYSVRIAQLLSPGVAAFARAQARLEVGNGRQFSTPFNFGNIGNTDDDPKGGGGFPNPEAAAEAWVAFVTNHGGPTRYQPFLDAGRSGADVATLAQLISQEGYATDPDYAAKVAAFAGT
jgi:hypothetical protein